MMLDPQNTQNDPFYPFWPQNPQKPLKTPKMAPPPKKGQKTPFFYLRVHPPWHPFFVQICEFRTGQNSCFPNFGLMPPIPVWPPPTPHGTPWIPRCQVTPKVTPVTSRHSSCHGTFVGYPLEIGLLPLITWPLRSIQSLINRNGLYRYTLRLISWSNPNPLPQYHIILLTTFIHHIPKRLFPSREIFGSLPRSPLFMFSIYTV